MLILTEKKSEAEKFVKIFDASYNEKKARYEAPEKGVIIEFAMGHLYRLRKPEEISEEFKTWKKEHLPLLPERITTCPIEGKEKKIRTLEASLKEAREKREEIMVATDPDREGEVIARMILSINGISPRTNRITRFWISEAPESAIVKRGIADRKDDSFYDALYESGLAMKKSDWMFGMNMTRLFTLRTGNLMTVGRVQTAVLNEIYDRETQVSLHVKEYYYEGIVRTTEGEEALVVVGGKSALGEEEEEALDAKIRRIEKGDVIVTDGISKKRGKEACPLLYDLSTLLSDINSIYGYSLKESTALIEEMYLTDRCISYPRTDSVTLGDDNVETYRKRLGEILKTGRYGDVRIREEFISGENRRLFNSANTQGHHGIIPCRPYDGKDERKKNIYDLVERRFVMQCLGDRVTDTVKFAGHIRGKEDIHLESVRTVGIEEGWHELALRKEGGRKGISGEYLMNIVESVEKVKKEKKPPVRYTQGTLIAWMKNPKRKAEDGSRIYGIGTQATRTEIIARLFEVGYIEEKKGKIYITEKGVTLVEAIRECGTLYEAVKPEETTVWEKLSDTEPSSLIEKTRKKVTEVVSELIKTINEHPVNTVGRCPLCSGDVVEGRGSFYCLGKKDGTCTFSLSRKIKDKEVTEADAAALLERGETGLIGNMFRLKLKNKEVKLEFEKIKAADCPLCGGSVLEGRDAYRCDRCSLVLWRNSFGCEIKGDTVRLLLSGRKAEKMKCRTKDGRPYQATLVFSDGRIQIERSLKKNEQ